jgi:flagellar biosynthesis protein FlhA
MELGEQVIGQIIAKPKALVVAAAFLVLLAFTGLPTMPLMVMASACAALAAIVHRRDTDQRLSLFPGNPGEGRGEGDSPSPSVRAPGDGEHQEAVEKLLELQTLELEIGPGLLKLADAERGGDLLDRIKELRRHLALELGMIVPAVRVHDNPDLSANDYIIRIRGQSIARGVTYPEQFLAVAPADVTEMPDAESTACPVTQAPAYWITDSQLAQARSLGYDILEAPDVLINHLAEIIRTHAHELLSRQEVKNLLDNLKLRCAALVDEVVPTQIKAGELHRVLQNLLRERVSIRDLETILESVTDHSSGTRNLDELSERARHALGRSICRQYADEHNRLACFTLDPELEQAIAQHVEQHPPGHTPGLPPQQVQLLIEQLARESDQLCQTHHTPVLLCSPPIRAAVRRLLELRLPRVPVLSFTEISPDVSIESLGCIGSPVEAAPVSHSED